MVLGLSVLAFAVYSLVPPEPSYQGKTVRDWLTLYSTNRDESLRAIRQIGTDALPWLVADLRAKDPFWKKKLAEFAQRQSWIKIIFTPDSTRRVRAVEACAALGPLAKPAIPALGVALGNGAGGAARVLEQFGPEAIPALIHALTNAPGCGAPYSTALALGKFGAKARVAVTNLVWEFENYPIGYPRWASAKALSEICQELIENEKQSDCPEVVYAKAALISGLSDTKPVVRRSAAEALAAFKTHAQAATPALRKLLDDSQLEVRQAATNALRAIAPEATSQTEVET